MWWNERFTSWMCSRKICSNCVMLSCQYGPKSLRNVSKTLLNLCNEELRQFWRQKGVQPGTSKIYIIKCPVSVCVCMYVYIYIYIYIYIYMYVFVCVYITLNCLLHFLYLVLVLRLFFFFLTGITGFLKLKIIQIMYYLIKYALICVHFQIRNLNIG